MQTTVTYRPSEAAETISLWDWIKSRVFRRDLSLPQRLAKGEIVRVVMGGGACLECHGGTVWITSDEGGPDIVLSAGGEARFARRTSVLLEALQESRLALRG